MTQQDYYDLIIAESDAIATVLESEIILAKSTPSGTVRPIRIEHKSILVEWLVIESIHYTNHAGSPAWKAERSRDYFGAAVYEG